MRTCEDVQGLEYAELGRRGRNNVRQEVEQRKAAVSEALGREEYVFPVELVRFFSGRRAGQASDVRCYMTTVL